MLEVRVRSVCAVWVAAVALAAADNNRSYFDTGKRIPWTESRILGTPEPPDPYRLEVAFPRLTFESPIDLVAIPRTNRMAVVEHNKGISTFAVDPKSKKRQVMLSEKPGVQLFAAAFHPKFTDNGYAFYTYIDAKAVHLARVTCTTTSGVPRADPGSKKIIFSWPTGGHTGGCVRFGPDGFLYLATGDGSGHSDTNQYSQNINDPRGSILRLDVDQSDGDRPYRVPPDNPFVKYTAAVHETFAYGLRQPWKIEFDSAGRLWAGDVGQDLWEMVHIIHKGANYGWSITEGSHPFRPERKRGPTAIVPPIVEHHHNEFRSITGGHVYTSNRIPEFRDAYIYGDFDTGRIWMLRYDGKKVTQQKQLCTAQARIVGFGKDHQGEVYVVGYASGKIYRLRPVPVQEDLPEFPRKLSQTGLFSSTADHQPAPGLIPYSINAPTYTDGAIIERYLGIPGDGKIELDALTYPNGPGAPPGWRFPDGTVLVQSMSMPQDSNDPKTKNIRRLETRILHHMRMPGSDEQYGAQIWHGYTFIWNDDQTDAELAPAAGLDRTLSILENGSPRPLTWRVPSRNECTVCHNIAAKHVIAMNTMQMNRTHDYGRTIENQLTVFDRLGLFAKRLPKQPTQLDRLADYANETIRVDDRARSYLHANCAHCHRQWGGGNANFQLLVTLKPEEMRIIDKASTHGDFGIGNAKLIASGSPYESTLLYRMASIGSARMPRLGTRTVDEQGLRLIHDWIAGLERKGTEVQPEKSPSNLPAEFTGDAPSDTTTSLIDTWLSDTSLSLRLIRGIDAKETSDSIRNLVLEHATTSAEPHIRDLFDRYLPEEKRMKRLGDTVNPDAIFALEGDVKRGETLFFNSKILQCRNCHQINERGIKLGPDLSHIAKEHDRFRMLDSIVNPSREIKKEYQVYLVQTVDGNIHSGIRMPDVDNQIILKDVNNKEIRIAENDVEEIIMQKTSMMPESMVRSMTAQQLADLLAYLGSLK